MKTLITNSKKLSHKLFSSFSKLIIAALLIFSFGFIIPEQNQMPVEGATARDWNPQSFWYFPWGRSRVHRGLDIFAKQGTPVVAPTGGFVLYSGEIQMGGNVVFMIGQVHWST